MLRRRGEKESIEGEEGRKGRGEESMRRESGKEGEKERSREGEKGEGRRGKGESKTGDRELIIF